MFCVILQCSRYTFDHIWTNILTQCTPVPVPVFCCFVFQVFLGQGGAWGPWSTSGCPLRLYIPLVPKPSMTEPFSRSLLCSAAALPTSGTPGALFPAPYRRE